MHARILLGPMVLVALAGADWPQHLGPDRNGVSPETGLLARWPQGGPKLLWTFPQAGVGYAGPAVVGDRLYLAGGRDGADQVFAIDVKTGKELWAAKIGPLFTWKGNQWNAGPNVTPTAAGDLVYALGGGGDLVCVAAADGKERWRKSLPRDLGGEVNPIGGGAEEPTPLGWGYAGAPLADGDRLICAVGGRQGLLAALDRQTGKVIWQSKEVTDQTSYASPVVVTWGGVRQYVQLTNRGLVGVAAADGKQLWAYDRQPPFMDVVINTPLVRDNLIYLTAGFGEGCDLVKVTAAGQAFRAERVYANKVMVNRDGGAVLVGDHVYGYSEDKGWTCQELATGKAAWVERRKLGRGPVSAAEGRLYCVDEAAGTVVLAAATPQGWQEHGRFDLPQASTLRKPSGRIWTHPVIANGRLYLRDQDLVFCYEVAGK